MSWVAEGLRVRGGHILKGGFSGGLTGEAAGTRAQRRDDGDGTTGAYWGQVESEEHLAKKLHCHILE